MMAWLIVYQVDRQNSQQNVTTKFNKWKKDHLQPISLPGPENESILATRAHLKSAKKQWKRCSVKWKWGSLFRQSKFRFHFHFIQISFFNMSSHSISGRASLCINTVSASPRIVWIRGWMYLLDRPILDEGTSQPMYISSVADVDGI